MTKTRLPPPPQRAILSRLSFLHQASALLSQPSAESPVGLSRLYSSHLLAVSRKSVQRLSPTVKRTICKRCSSLLIAGVSCTTRVENTSKNGRKPWADILVIQCNFCKACKRFPTQNKKDFKKKSADDEIVGQEEAISSETAIKPRETGDGDKGVLVPMDICPADGPAREALKPQSAPAPATAK